MMLPAPMFVYRLSVGPLQDPNADYSGSHESIIARLCAVQCKAGWLILQQREAVLETMHTQYARSYIMHVTRMMPIDR